jgi:hypothetical protein
MRLAGVGEIPLDGHIWPPNSDQPEYQLGNRAAARQGFYFYRNNRLIQAGGWNGLLQNEAEPSRTARWRASGSICRHPSTTVSVSMCRSHR